MGDCIVFTSVRDLRKQPVKLKKGHSQSPQKERKNHPPTLCFLIPRPYILTTH